MGAAAKVKWRWRLLEKEVSGPVRLKQWTASSMRMWLTIVGGEKKSLYCPKMVLT